MTVEKALLIWVPSRRGRGAGKTFPVGLLYVGRVLEDLGVTVNIFDLYQYAFNKKSDDTFCTAEIIDAISRNKPDIIGFGGIASSYGWTKRLSITIRKKFPNIMQVAGGALASTYALLLTETAIDVVFHGESEMNVPLFIRRLKEGENIYDVPGISYLSQEGIIKNPPPQQVEDLDDIPFPAYHLVDIESYFPQDASFAEGFLKQYRNDLKYQGIFDEIKRKINGVETLFPIVTARGCTHHCSFCYRHMKKYRKHSVDYVIKHIQYINEHFNAQGISFYDELFNGDMKWVFDFCDAIEKHGVKIAYKTSARADKVSREMLTRMSETGCFNLEFGQESGSDKILKEYRKGITSKQNFETTLLPRECGIYSAVQLVIGSPGETRETILETIDFLKKAKVTTYSLNYLLPFPGAPIWKFVEEKHLIEDVEEYLDQVSKTGGRALVNLTEVQDKEWKNWAYYIRYHLDRHNALVQRNIILFVRVCIVYVLKKILPDRVIRAIRAVIRKHL